MYAATISLYSPAAIFTAGLLLLILFFLYFTASGAGRKRNIGTILIAGVLALCLAAVFPPKERLKGGIDILGGSSFTLRVQPKDNGDGTRQAVSVEQVEQAIAVIEKRLNAMGAAEPFIARQGADRILVQMPGVEPEESARIRETLEKVAKLELREVHPRSGETDAGGMTLAARVAAGAEVVPGYRAFPLEWKGEDGAVHREHLLLSRRAALGGADISGAYPAPRQNDAVAITLNGAGADKMIDLTKEMEAGRDRIAILLDGAVINAPVVQAVPLGKDFVVSGLREPGEVRSLANALMNPLENQLLVEAASSVSASFGASIVKQGIWSGIVGLAVTFAFVLLYYRLAGMVAVLGLIVNGVLLFGAMALFGFTFSLPGIAGMVLTIGMAVDANVLIYERLREEIAAGKALRSAISTAYDKAFSAIFDANLTSLITAVILFWLASGTIKGFAVTLTIGLLASMFSAILVTRVLFQWGMDLGWIRKLRFLDLIPATKFDFLRTRFVCGWLSLVLVLAGIAGFAWRGSEALGIDFTGGTLIRFELGDRPVVLGDVSAVLERLDLAKEAYPQEESNPTSGTMLSVRCDTPDADRIVAALREGIPALGEKRTDAEEGGSYLVKANREEVSAVIGGTMLGQSLVALVLGMLGILAYIAARFEFSYSLGGFVAVVHDVVATVGVVVLCGGQLSLIHVGAILTVAGYSINDTIVIFDRIRESLRAEGGTLGDKINEAINATLSRTLLTSSTTILTVAILLVFGGSALRDFSFTILVGLLIGTYSSVFIASPLVLWWNGRKAAGARAEGIAGDDSGKSFFQSVP